MNKFNYDLGRRCLIAEGWCPVAKTEAIQLALRVGRDRSGAPIPSVLDIIKTNDSPPTHFSTNKVRFIPLFSPLVLILFHMTSSNSFRSQADLTILYLHMVLLVTVKLTLPSSLSSLFLSNSELCLVMLVTVLYYYLPHAG